ncbi:hypothetical protein KUTeg_003898 [Tegillarca granosa]|uniref:Cation/H+ exchanger transmembrane domain-containing protein n=1 Tax=Tegillarca granosa TaxID=220873 RepID=A0ABQ9FS79_TEGGR|nr:hypothetical protein KUTeg_003898 [Tegillarca granosa]
MSKSDVTDDVLVVLKLFASVKMANNTTSYGGKEKKNSLELNSTHEDGNTLLETGSASIVIQQEDGVKTPKKCQKLRLFCHRLCKPVRTKYNPLPENASCLQRFKHALMCPPFGNLAGYINFFCLAAFIWMVLISVTEEGALPGGNFFSLFVLFFAAVSCGYLISFLRLPPLLGMLLAGALLRNVPVVKIVGDSIDKNWSGDLRAIALTVILIRAGLGLDPKALKKLSFTVLRLAFAPCLVECCAEAVAAHLLLGFPWPFAFLLGFVLAAVSPAVVVPSLLGLSDRGYGLNKGIPTLVIAAASVDDVLAITGFGIVLGIAFAGKGDPLAWAILKGPVEAVIGIIYGIVVGMFLWYIPSKDNVSYKKIAQY